MPGRKATHDQAFTLESFRRAGEGIVVKSEAEVLDVSYERMELDGDVVVRVMVWTGETSASWDKAKQRLVNIQRIDATPVYEYTMRKADGGWRIVGRRWSSSPRTSPPKSTVRPCRISSSRSRRRTTPFDTAASSGFAQSSTRTTSFPTE